MAAISILIDNFLVGIDLGPTLLSLSSLPVRARAFLVFQWGKRRGFIGKRRQPKRESVLLGKKPGGFPRFLPCFCSFLAYSKSTKGEILKGNPFSVVLCPHGHFLPLTTPRSPVLQPRNTGRGKRGRGATQLVSKRNFFPHQQC